jgi:DNA-binding response OmpR family regulator
MEATIMPRIFLVEDDEAIAKNLALLLRSEGFTVKRSSTQKEALAVLDEGKLDLALIDIALPDGSGFAVCTAVKETQNIPVILSSQNHTYHIALKRVYQAILLSIIR